MRKHIYIRTNYKDRIVKETQKIQKKIPKYSMNDWVEEAIREKLSTATH